MSRISYIGTIEDDAALSDAACIILYGAGKVGRHALRVLREKGLGERVACFCDSAPGLWGKEAEGIPILSPAQACGGRYPRGTYLVAGMCVRQMTETLLLHGAEDIHVIRES